MQFVDNKVIVEFDALDASVEMELDSNTREYLMIDVDTGEILKEIESIIYS